MASKETLGGGLIDWGYINSHTLEEILEDIERENIRRIPKNLLT